MFDKLKINLAKPLAFIEIKTTGPDFQKDRIYEINIIKTFPDGSTKGGVKLIDPEMEIPANVVALYGVTNEKVKGQPNFKNSAKKLAEFLSDCDLAGNNLMEFELKFLSEEFLNAGMQFNMNGKKIFDLSQIYKTTVPYVIEYKKTVNAETIGSTQPEKKKSMDIGGYIVLNEQGRPIFSTGKHINQLVSESCLSDTVYLNWVMNNSEYPADTKILVQKIVEKAKKAKLVGAK